VEPTPQVDLEPQAPSAAAHCPPEAVCPEERPRVLLVCADDSRARPVVDHLRLERHCVLRVSSAAAAWTAAATLVPDAVVLDLPLPDAPGFELCKSLLVLRTDRGRRPVLVVCGDGDEAARVSALELGVDDYVPRPFSLRELALRLRARLRPPFAAANAYVPGFVGPDRIQLGALWVDFSSQQARVGGRAVALTRSELRLLRALAFHAGQVCTTAALQSESGRGSEAEGSRALATRVARLRRKLGPAGAVIQTVHGVGYRLVFPTRSI
jgi:two-component system phosphate regulon response regulator PhoB